MLRLHDTATAQVCPLALRQPGAVSLYVCGPTVYDAPHLGHGRFALVFDVLRRYLIASGLEVTYVSNITDVDDKVIERAHTEGVEPAVLARRYEEVWWTAMDALGVLRPDHVPHATAYVARMVELIAELVARGVAYETPDGVYLSTEAVPGYGLLAHQPLDTLRAGARVETVEAKRSPLDFVLWKKAKPGEPTWPSPWGPGRPGWHTECVVMSLDLLGEGFDVHGGAIDLIFPHHENERAQAVALGRDFAHHWVHNGWVTVAGEKMSKSLGNFTSLDDLLARSDPRAYRLLVVRAHYRSPIEVTPETIRQAESGLARLDELARRFGLADLLATGGPVTSVTGAGEDDLDQAAVARFVERMDDDLDTPAALSGIFELAREANAAADAGHDQPAARAARTAAHLAAVLGLSLRGAQPTVEDPEVLDLMARRDVARAERRFADADALRAELVERGWVVEDAAEGTRVRRP
ncbi:MAG: cysteine--tRNA ligase [Actinomycetota bacterium]|nr:cysteine--tRNA ligase [Actinomycetota bacterium]MDA8294625.1 cysteine--tRNA ligase [Actinomycetota bacterium]